MKTKRLIFIASLTLHLLFMISCNDTKLKVTSEISEKIDTLSDSISYGNLIGKWSLKTPNKNVTYQIFTIDSGGFHHITDSSINHYKLLIKDDMFIIGINVAKNKNLITHHSADTLTIYWTSGQHETYIRQDK